MFVNICESHGPQKKALSLTDWLPHNDGIGRERGLAATDTVLGKHPELVGRPLDETDGREVGRGHLLADVAHRPADGRARLRLDHVVRDGTSAIVVRRCPAQGDCRTGRAGDLRLARRPRNVCGNDKYTYYPMRVILSTYHDDIINVCTIYVVVVIYRMWYTASSVICYILDAILVMYLLIYIVTVLLFIFTILIRLFLMVNILFFNISISELMKGLCKLSGWPVR